MTTLYLEGFEHISQTTPSVGQVLPAEFAQFFELETPAVTADWFINEAGTQDETSGPMVVPDGRVSGQCMRIRRPNASTNNATYNGSVVLPLRKVIANSDHVITGFAVRFDRLPETDEVPLMRMAYDDGSTIAEQLSLWADRSGRVFLGLDNVAFDDTVVVTEPIVSSITDKLKMNFQKWTYLEVEVNLSGDTPSVTIDCNGIRVIQLSDEDVQKVAATATVNVVELINPHNGYFGDNDFTQWLDDWYILNGDGVANNQIIGPQYIMRVPVGDPFHTSWNTTGAASTKKAVEGQYDKTDFGAFAQATLDALTMHVSPEPLPAEVGWINAMGITVMTAVTGGSDDLVVSMGDGEFEDERSFTVTNTNPEKRAAYYDLNPLLHNWNRERFALARAKVGS